MTRAEAKQLGLKRYFTGNPCPYGHVADRFVSCSHCVKCNQKKGAAWKTANPDRVSEIRRASRIKHLDKIKERMGVWLKANRRRCQEATNAWRKGNSDLWLSYVASRRAKKLNAEGVYNIDDIKALIKKQQNRCLCGVSFKAVKRTVDHKTPLSRGGSNWPRNLQLLCVSCNSSKGARTQQEWRRVA